MTAVERAYGLLFRVVLVRMDPEHAHHAAVLVLRVVGGVPPLRRAVAALCRPPAGAGVEAAGLRFAGPFGLAAGFDKNAVAVAGLGALGFTHVEVGTVTALPQPGNPRPRLFRLVADRSLINRMGFNNQGAAAVARRLAALRSRGTPGTVVGVNIGKSRAVAIEDAVGDYSASARLLAPHADYLAVNVSSPNTPGLRGLQDPALLEPLLAAVRAEAGGVPVFVKIAPDLHDDDVRGIATLAAGLGLAGVIATNTTTSRTGLTLHPAAVERMGSGGLSGPPLAARALDVLRVLRAALPADAVVISAGGVTTVDDVAARLDAGADLVQGYTAFLYRGPGWAAELNRATRSGRVSAAAARA